MERKEKMHKTIDNKKQSTLVNSMRREVMEDVPML